MFGSASRITVMVFFILILLFCISTTVTAQDGKLRIIAFGAHPDDCEIKAGGVAAKWAAQGHLVKFVSVTNGDIGHWKIAGGLLHNAETKRYKTLQRYSVSRQKSLISTTANLCRHWRTVKESYGSSVNGRLTLLSATVPMTTIPTIVILASSSRMQRSW